MLIRNFPFVFIAILFSLLVAIPLQAEDSLISVYPSEIRQGDPLLIQINGLNETSTIKNLKFGAKNLGVFMYQGKPSALMGIDLNKKVGDYEISLELINGEIFKKNVEVVLRDKIEKPLGIPEKLGGNTKASQDKLVSTLNEDNKILLNTRTNKKSLWKEKFIPPLKTIYITAPYGNSRKTGKYSIPHKGVDYRAKEGTDILAINRGVVRLTQEFRNHGKTIVIDHGQGLVSYYLHLSKYNVKVGDVVERGQVIAKSGATGYTLGAHLHFAIRINGISIDPVKFFELFK